MFDTQNENLGSIPGVPRDLLVVKIGGSMLPSSNGMQPYLDVAAYVKELIRTGDQVVLVVSAQKGRTDALITQVNHAAGDEKPNPFAMTLLVATGEQESAALMVLALQQVGVPAVPIMGWQAGLLTLRSDDPTNARLEKFNPSPILGLLDQGKVVVVAGFQAVDPSGRCVLLGRGGSDATAMALAEGLGAKCCFVKDTGGICSADPKLIPEAQVVTNMTHAELCELTGNGSRIIQEETAEAAMMAGIPLLVTGLKGEHRTLVSAQALAAQRPVTAITSLSNVGYLNFFDGEVGVAERNLGILGSIGVNVDMVEHGHLNIAVSLPAVDVRRAYEACKRARWSQSITHHTPCTKIVMVGAGMATEPAVLDRALTALRDEQIEIVMLTTSGISISFLVRAEDGKRALEALHQAFFPAT